MDFPEIVWRPQSGITAGSSPKVGIDISKSCQNLYKFIMILSIWILIGWWFVKTLKLILGQKKIMLENCSYLTWKTIFFTPSIIVKSIVVYEFIFSIFILFSSVKTSYCKELMMNISYFIVVAIDVTVDFDRMWLNQLNRILQAMNYVCIWGLCCH